MSDNGETNSTTDEKPEGSAAEGESTEEKPEGDAGDAGEGEGEKPEPKPEDELPEWAKKELTKVRGEAANYRVKLREAQEALANAKTPEEFEAATAELTSQVATLERSLLIGSVATTFKLPPELAAVLKGDTEDELTAHAKELAKFVPVEEDEDVDLSGGLTPDERDDDPDDPAELARKYGRGRRKRV